MIVGHDHVTNNGVVNLNFWLGEILVITAIIQWFRNTELVTANYINVINGRT